MPYVIADPHLGGYYKSYTKRVPTITEAKTWKRENYAVEEASLINVSRNVPPGQVQSHKYQNLPNAEVHEIDGAGNAIAVIPAPPSYISL
jgi:hypothetical protein